MPVLPLNAKTSAHGQWVELISVPHTRTLCQQGETLLMIAAWRCWPVIVKLLVSLGADTTVKDKLVNPLLNLCN